MTMNTTDQIIFEALQFERDHWQRLLDGRRRGWSSTSAMREWATERVADLQVIISRMEPFAKAEALTKEKQSDD